MSSSVAASLTVPSETRRQRGARRARRRLYPVSVLYSAYATAIVALGLRSGHRAVVAAFFAAGVVTWTLMEYFVHRVVLHGRFPDGPGAVRHRLHEYFDHLHWEHHARPWDGNHVSGTIRDTLHWVVLLGSLSFLAPLHTLPVLVAGILQSYIVEEWIHHSVHFCELQGRYFQYIKRHHLYHHSPRGSEVGYGLTSGFWDVVWQTRIPGPERRALYRRMS